MYEYLISSIIGGLLGGSITYVIAKHMFSTNRILDIFDDFTAELTQNTDMQKKVYILGILLGNGIKQGVGLTAKGGKFKMEDLIGQGIGALLQQFLGGTKKTQTQETTQQEGNPFEL